MTDHYISEDELDAFVEMINQPDASVVQQQVQARIQLWQAEGITDLARQLHSLRDDFSEKKAVLDYIGLPLQQTKDAFIWNEPRPPVEVPGRLTFRSFEEVGYNAFIDTIAKAHKGTFDRAMQQPMAAITRGELTKADWMKEEFDDAVEYFDHEPHWWQVAFTDDGTIVGYIQPVLFKDSIQGDLPEATIYYVGVVPEARGNGYVTDLLAKGVAVLQQVGVWRIYCDTDSKNFPMINAFKRAGWEADGVYYKWEGDIGSLKVG